MSTWLLALIITLGSSGAAGVIQHHHPQAGAAAFAIPESIIAEHKELHAQLEAVVRLGGQTGEAAQAVERALGPHFEKEEQLALPPLGLLKPLAEGPVTPEMHAVADLAVRLKADLPQMLEEHKVIVTALDALTRAARAEGRGSAVEFAEGLKRHAQYEEEVLYPAAVLVGQYVTLKTGK
jgi:hypothetical protein